MKKCEKVRKLIVICLSALFVLLPLTDTAYAVTSESQRVITPGKMKEWDNGAKVTTTSSGRGSNFQTNVTADTHGLKQGYYSVYLYDITERDASSYDGICFHLKNANNTAMKMNLTFTVDSKTSVTMTGSSYAILESDDQSVREAIAPVNGTISVPAHFDGSVYVPLSKLYTSDGKSISLTQIQSWGITAVMSENQQIKYQIGNIAFLSRSVASMKNSYYLITLTGNNKVAVPKMGSAIEFYHAQVKDLDGNPVNQSAVFSLKNNVAGAAISKNGELQISSSCSATEITVCSKLPNSADDGELTVSLQRGETVASVGIPKISDVPKITTLNEVRLNKIVNIIRFVAIVIALLLGAVFYSWFSEKQKNYILIKNKLLLPNDHEGEEKS